MDFLIPLTAIVMTFGIPLSAIIGSYYLKIQKLKAEGGGSLSKSDRNKILALVQENEQLKSRIENLEEIASDPDFIKIQGADNSKLQQQIDFLADEIRSMRKLSE